MERSVRKFLAKIWKSDWCECFPFAVMRYAIAETPSIHKQASTTYSHPINQPAKEKKSL
jgi:hypothetical protein